MSVFESKPEKSLAGLTAADVHLVSVEPIEGVGGFDRKGRRVTLEVKASMSERVAMILAEDLPQLTMIFEVTDSDIDDGDVVAEARRRFHNACRKLADATEAWAVPPASLRSPELTRSPVHN